MKKIIPLILVILWCGVADAATAQEVFDETFWLIMQVFCVGLTAGLAFKIINRS